MSWENRDYNTSGASGPDLSRMTLVHWFLGINVLVFLLDRIFTGAERAGVLSPYRWLNFNVAEAVYGWQIWRFFTYQFVHSLTDFIHIFFNMMILLTLGPSMEQWWGKKRFLVFYLACGVSGALVYLALFQVGVLNYDPRSTLVGASGSIYGICVGAAAVYPHQRLKMLWLPFELKMRTFAIVILAIAFLSLAAGSTNAGGEAAHLGGAALGFLLAAKPGLLAWADRVSPGTFKVKVVSQKKEKAAKKEVASEAEIDRILAKVSDQGLQSLTSKEKKALNRETDRKRG